MILRLDVVKVLWHIAWAVAWWRGELPWWAVVAVLGYYWTFQYQFVSPKLRREIKAAQEQKASLAASQLFVPQHLSSKDN